MGLATAIREQRWPEALAIALDEWRRLRSPELATLVDLVGRRCPQPPRQGKLQGWWIAHAVPYDATVVSTLVEHVTVHMRGSDWTSSALRGEWQNSELVHALDSEPGLRQHRNWFERVLAMLAWPHDPRVACVLADWLTHHEPFLRSRAFELVYGAIADLLVALADVRVVPQLEAFLADRDAGFRCQRAIVERVRAALVARHQVPDDPEIRSLVDQLALRDGGLAKLWQAVADRPADLDQRAILGDALLAAGDSRGELIALQLAIDRNPVGRTGDPRAKRLKQLLDAWRYRWLGSALAALLVRDGTEFRRGMLEVVRLGYVNTPLRAWEAARGHRELATVHTALVGRAPPIEYARLVASLPHLSTLEADAPATLLELAQRGTLPIETLIYARSSRVEGRVPPVLETFRSFAPTAPRITRVVVVPIPLGNELAGLLRELPSLFPQLAAIELPAPSRVIARELEAQFASLPLVEIR